MIRGCRRYRNFLEQTNKRFLEHKYFFFFFEILMREIKLVTHRMMNSNILHIFIRIYLTIVLIHFYAKMYFLGGLETRYQSYEHVQSATDSKKIVTEIYFQRDHQEVYTLISKLLKILVTLSVTTAIGERSSSSP